MKLTTHLLLEEEQFARWKDYLNDVPILKSAVKILKNIESKGYVAYIVGGAVRDLVLGISLKDVDIATNMPIDEIEKIYKTHDIGASKDFGIVVVREGGFTFEVANFRSDGEYIDGRRPETVKIVLTFEKDAARRDVTINSMGIDSSGNIIDYFNGQKDIKNKIIRTVGNPHDRFKEDHLRMLRVARFSSKLGFTIDKDTKDAIKDLASNVSKLSVERIKDEIFKAAGQNGDKFAKYLIELDDMGILQIILPEIVKMKEFKHFEDTHPEGGVFAHTIESLKKSNSLDPIVNLSILLHDVGKILTLGEKENGIPTYYGHAEEGINLVNVIADRLKLSNDERESIIFAVANHMKFHKILGMKPSKIAKIVTDKNWNVLVAVAKADEFSRGRGFSRSDFEKIVDTAIEIKEKWGQKTVNGIMKLVDGVHVMNLTGLKPGKQVGEIIKKTTEYILDNGVKNQEEIDNFILSLK